MASERNKAERRELLKTMAMIATVSGVASAAGAAAATETLTYGTGGYGNGPYPDGSA